MTENLAWAARLAEQHAAQAERNHLWRDHFAKAMPPGRERRSKLWLLSYYGRKARERAEFWRRVASCGNGT